LSDEILDGVVRPGPPPGNADRPAVVIRNADGKVVQAVIRIDDDTVVEVTASGIDPGTFALEMPAGPNTPGVRWDIGRSLWAHAYLSGAQVIDPRSIVTVTTTA
jgi:hypothetical protein